MSNLDVNVQRDTVNDKLILTISNPTTPPPTTQPPTTTTPTAGLQDDFSTNYVLSGGQVSPDNKWKLHYNGYGVVEVKNGLLNMRPREVTTAGNTSACLIMSQASFGDFECTFNMKTVSQTRKGSTPNNWEVGWFMIRYVDDTHHFYGYIGANGRVELGKKEYIKIGTTQVKTPDGTVTTVQTQDRQQFLFTKDNAVPLPVLGKSFKIKVVMVGNNIKLYVDDKLIADITDDGKIGTDGISGKRPIGWPTSILDGKFGLYCEDSFVQFDNVKISAL